MEGVGVNSSRRDKKAHKGFKHFAKFKGETFETVSSFPIQCFILKKHTSWLYYKIIEKYKLKDIFIYIYMNSIR